MSAPVVEDTTGYRTFMMIERKDTIIFYRTGREVAIYQKTDKKLVVTSKHEEDVSEMWEGLQTGAVIFGMEIADREAKKLEEQ